MLVVLLSCTLITPEEFDARLDYDQDGYTSTQFGGDDCNDNDETISPGLPEFCNGYDDNCDGKTDDDVAEDAPTWYADPDGDGYGSTEAVSCTRPEGYTNAGGDCNDGDAGIHPGTPEVWYDGIDQDCDALSDYDQDKDGFDLGNDCDDLDETFNPGVAEIWYDDVDQDCDRASDFDQDQDGFDSVAYGGDDCDDEAAEIYPGAPDEWYDGLDANCDGLSDFDADGDTWDSPISGGLDCDDADPAIHPDATEFCDGVDYDCDGATHEDDSFDALVWYIDSDGDTFGDPDTAHTACTQPADSEADRTDCDDSEPTIYPGAAEYCDLTDADCDGDVAEADSLNAPIWYQDADVDGYGSPAGTAIQCAAPSGFVALDTDCDDADAAISPAAFEVCDAINADEDCNGSADNDDGGATGETTAYLDADGDSFGDELSPLTVCDHPAEYVFDSTDCDDTQALVNPAGTEICDPFDTDEDCDGLLDQADDSVLDAVDAFVDLDADGFGDSGSDVVPVCEYTDGFVSNQDDCDDADESIYPAAVEYCDVVDSDCDGDLAEADSIDAPTWFIDQDTDGFGSAATTAVACAAPAGFVALDTDCDDANAVISPAGAEVCDSLNTDEDCDDVTDNDDSSATGMLTYYADVDDDHYGNAASTIAVCDRPANYVTNNSDCDDTEGDINPGEDEVCDSLNEDEDCDGLPDESDPNVVDAGDYYVDADRDGYGAGGSAIVPLCQSATGYVTNDADCDDGDATVTPAEGDCAIDLGAADVILEGEVKYGQAGFSVASGDLDGDGKADVLVGAANERSGSSIAGAAYVVENITTGSSGLNSAAATYLGGSSSDNLGFAGAIGDVDGDGLADAIVGAPGAGGSGAAYLFLGPPTGSAPDATYSSLGGFGGSALAVGDLDGDSYADLVVGAPSAVNGGSLYVFSEFAAGAIGVSAASFKVSGGSAADVSNFGGALAAGDVDGDGLADVLVGASTSEDNTGTAYLFQSPRSGTILASAADAALTGDDRGDRAGSAVAVADMDGDGAGDLVVGAFLDSPSGAVSIFTNLPAGNVYLASSDAHVYGVAGNAGWSVAAGDTNGDGVGEVVIGSYYSSNVYLVRGPVAGTLSLSGADAAFVGESTSDSAGYGVATGDVDADGLDDVIIGAFRNDNALTDAGAAYIIYGNGL